MDGEIEIFGLGPAGCVFEIGDGDTGGIHGGNRVGGNAVCDFIVFGRIAGQSASDFAEASGVDQAA